MSTDLTTIPSSILIGTYIIVSGYSLATIISTIICLLVFALVYLTPSLHSPTNLLISNTCLCTLFFSIVTTSITYFYYTESTSTDWSCRMRGYLTYVSICLVVYSYVIQAVSRLFWTVLYKHRYLLTIKCHVYLICLQMFLSFLFPLSSLLTTNITFRPFRLCLVPIQYRIHAFYILGAIYIIPILITIVLYVIIYCHTRISSLKVRRPLQNIKRDAELARNILILFSIFIFGGVPLSIYVMLSSKTDPLPTGFYLFALFAPALAITTEKIATIVLNKEIRKIVNKRWMTWYAFCFSSTTRVEHFSSSDNTNRNNIQTMQKVHPTITI